MWSWQNIATYPEKIKGECDFASYKNKFQVMKT